MGLKEGWEDKEFLVSITLLFSVVFLAVVFSSGFGRAVIVQDGYCDPDNCPPPNDYCGDDICDPAEENATTCAYDCGPPPPTCGNGALETGEQCDGNSLGGQTCSGLGFVAGTLSCTDSCTFDTSACFDFSNPIGNHTASTCTVTTGWTCDANDFTKTLNAEIYRDGQKGSGGVLLGTATANQNGGQAVADQCGGDANHAFTFNMPNLNDSTNHSIYAYGVDPAGFKFQSRDNPASLSNDGSVGNLAWNNSNNAQNSDDVYAAAKTRNQVNGQTSNYLKATGFGFSIPSTATIKGIVVEYEADRDPNSVKRAKFRGIRIVRGGGISGTDHGDNSWVVKAPDVYRAFGGATDLWNVTLTPADVNAAGFGFVLSVFVKSSDGSSQGVRLDHVRVTVYYTEPVGTLLQNSPKTINCAAPIECGNGNIDAGEQCDDGNLNGQTCQSQGFGGGTLGCTSLCTFDTSQCIPGCVLNSAKWSVDQTVKGNVVDLEVTTTHCENETLSFEVKERDTLNADDPVTTNPPNVFIALDGGITLSNWTAEWQSEGWPESDPPEYYFKATLVSTGENIQSSSPDLEVLQQAPQLCENVVTCAGYTNQVDCEDDICSVAANSVANCNDPNETPFCSWNNNTNVCGGACRVEDNGTNVGTCFYTEETTDTCEDDGYLTVNLNATWIWDPECYADPDCQAENQDEAAACQSTTEVLQCPAQIPLPFFGVYNFLAALVLIAAIYWAISMRRQKKRARKR
ncbi:MAG TPA: hypothetical protein VJ142_02275 [Candidatus Nanoarchaeia archaeon]|nr:hypothetical protein [Candidatus Nanoarchaeia archaeon]